MAGLVIGLVGFVTDAALVRARGSAGSPWLAAGLVAGALGTLLGLLAAPALAAIHAAAIVLARSAELRRVARAPVAPGAIAVGMRMAHVEITDVPRHPHAFEILVVGFAAVVVILSALWSRASSRWARGAALAVAVAAIAADVATPRALYRDGHDLAAMIAAAAIVVVARPAFESARRARASALAAGAGALLAAALAMGANIDRLRPGWRASAVRDGHYVPRLARAFRLLVDFDDDGYSPVAWGGDCDDRDPRRNPSAHESVPGRDMNCNGVALPAHPTDADRGLAPPEGSPELPRGAVDRAVLITVDCLRADAMVAARMPRLAALAARGLVLDRVYAGGSQTEISLALVQRSHDHGVPLATRLARGGVTSSAFLSLPHGVKDLADGYGVAASPPNVSHRWSATQVTDLAVADLRKSAAPHLVWAHYFDAHAPYDPIPGEEQGSPRPREAYLARVAYVDREIGRLLDALDALDPGLARTAVLVTADHGEALGAHGLSFHGISTWEPIVHVAAVLAAPGVAPGRWGGLASHRDIAATLLGVFGFAAEAQDAELFGRSWVRLATEPRPPLHRFVVTRSFRAITLLLGGTSPQAAIVEGDLKLSKTFDDGLREMYDVAADPAEENDVEPTRAADAARLEHDLELYRDLDGYP